MRPTKERVQELLRYDPATGEFTWKRRVNNAQRSQVAGTVNSGGYRQISIDGRLQYAHRLAWLLMVGSWPDLMIDHVNGSRADNRWSNLREVDGSVNGQNRRAARTSSRTGLLGAFVFRDRFQSEIAVDGKRFYLGNSFATAEAAHAAYLDAKARLHPGSTL